MATKNAITIGPQPGPQTTFLSTSADIAIYGGAAGGGKSYGLLLEVLRHYNNPRFGAVVFRRTTTQIRNEGGLWDESQGLYQLLNARPREAVLEWTFPSGARVKFAHLEFDKTVTEWHGSQIPLICFDELTTFTEYQFWYMLSRNRSTSGVPGYIRATCNPDPDSFVRKLIDWWIGADGYPIAERSGKIRWFVRLNDTLEWGNSREELIKKFGPLVEPKSLTFIAAKLSDNKILMDKNPSYRANLMALNRVERMRLLEGNWNVRATAGLMFRREWFPIVDVVPGGWVKIIRFWDRAASKPTAERPNPDWTRGTKVYAYPDGTYLVADLKSAQDTPRGVEVLIKNVASHDGYECKIKAQQDPGSAGKAEAEHFIRLLGGYDVHVEPFQKDKQTRAKGVSAQCEAGNVKVLRAPWNDEFFKELENFPEGAHDDIVDTLSGAYNDMVGDPSMIDVNDGLAGAFSYF